MPLIPNYNEIILELKGLNERREQLLRAMLDMREDPGLNLAINIERDQRASYTIHADLMTSAERQELFTSISAALSIIVTDIEQEMEELGKKLTREEG